MESNQVKKLAVEKVGTISPRIHQATEKNAPKELVVEWVDMLIGLSEDGDEKIIHTPRYCSVTEAVDLARQVYVTSLWVKNGNNADTPITVEFWCGIKATMPSNAELLALWLRDTHGLLI